MKQETGNKPVITLADTHGAVFSFAVSTDYLMRVFDSLHKYGEPLPPFSMPAGGIDKPASKPAGYGMPGYTAPGSKPASKPASKPGGDNSGGGIKPAPVIPDNKPGGNGGAVFADSLAAILKTI